MTAVIASLCVIILFRLPWTVTTIRRLEGQVILVDNPSMDLVLPLKGKGAIAYRIRNVTSALVKVYAVDACCGVTLGSKLPLVIAANSESEVMFSISASAIEGRAADRTMRLFVDVPSPPIILTAHLSVDEDSADAVRH